MDSIISLQLEAQKTSKLNKRLWKTPNFKEMTCQFLPMDGKWMDHYEERRELQKYFSYASWSSRSTPKTFASLLVSIHPVSRELAHLSQNRTGYFRSLHIIFFSWFRHLRFPNAEQSAMFSQWTRYT